MLHTIPGFDTLTEQQVFDMAVSHIATTRQPSISEINVDGVQCAYGGSGCNAAPFLTEEGKRLGDQLTETGEGGSWRDLVQKKWASDANMELIIELQIVHDDAAAVAADITGNIDNSIFLNAYKERMVRIADKRNLNISALASLTN